MFLSKSQAETVALYTVTKKNVNSSLKKASPMVRAWLKANDFSASSGELCIVPDKKGKIDSVYLGVSGTDDGQAFAIAAKKLPKGSYQADKLSKVQALYWGLAHYQFDKYKSAHSLDTHLVLKRGMVKEVTTMVEATGLVRDLINTPCEDMGPDALSQEMQALCKDHDAGFSEIVGEDLLEHGFPAVHTVGRAATNPPRLLELTWGEKKHPQVCLVGKGVCFDSGGLDIKPSSNMLLMKKDMGGSAHVLGLAKMIMAMELPVRLSVIIPAVENAISGNAYRPGDVVHTRKGVTIEVGNTDAEGRVILADALAYAEEKRPKLLLDFATLTGAARVAVGTDIAALFCNDDKLADSLYQGGKEWQDSVWRLPLHEPYNALIKGEVADISNTGRSGYGGAITAALFLQHFVSTKTPWAHLDIMAWNTQSRPGKPKGGEALGLYAAYAMLCERFKR